MLNRERGTYTEYGILTKLPSEANKWLQVFKCLAVLLDLYARTIYLLVIPYVTVRPCVDHSFIHHLFFIQSDRHASIKSFLYYFRHLTSQTNSNTVILKNRNSLASELNQSLLFIFHTSISASICQLNAVLI